MFLVLWEFEVKPGSEERFERVYGPFGNWASLFQHDPNHVKTELLRDISRKNSYCTADYWNTRTAYEQFLLTRSAEYKALDAECQDLTLAERHIGSYELVHR